jgi:Zn-dependent M28 family amino/carboxypeptidase
VLVCFFSGEEHGLLGSAAFCKSPPVPKDSMVAMVNLDMVGRGKPTELAILGLDENPSLEPVLDRALKLAPTKVRNVLRHKFQELFARADHYSFHQAGVPAVFLFEGPVDENKDYHTWRDTAELADATKIAAAARLGFNLVWLLGNDAERPPPPKKPKS